MYLKEIEILGFKSFAQKTRLVFEPGITAIVGPNGCGKSNISDAVRWVLGEQRPTALRGSAMADVIFSGTESRKQLGMAQVSITFADCEEKLGTEYNEVTITRRVFRSGEGQYFINRKACRLRDIQRLFMGTGVGTTSYSVMAQGQIDAILSSRPEDRRAVFEEAGGITRFKADRREALRKLEQTDANLLRLSDVIAEVKRQIGSLQRQAGKARRYRTLSDELRELDTWDTGRRIQALDSEKARIEAEMRKLNSSIETRLHELSTNEKCNTADRRGFADLETEIAATLEAAMQARAKLSRAREAMRANARRIEEYRSWALRDERELNETRAIIERQRSAIEEIAKKAEELKTEAGEAEKLRLRAQERFDELREETDTARRRLQEIRSRSIESEKAAARAQNELSECMARERGSLLRREKLESEKEQLSRSMESLRETCDKLRQERDSLAAGCTKLEERWSASEAIRGKHAASARENQQRLSAIQARIAARQARIQMLEDPRETAGDYPAGSRMLLDSANKLKLPAGVVLGKLADRISAPVEIRPALEAALRPWLDALLVRDTAAATEILEALLATGEKLSSRLVAATGPASETKPLLDLPRLLDKLQLKPDFRDAARRMLAQVYLVDTPADAPRPIPAGCSFVTPDGILLRDDGACELWKPEGVAANPLARHMLAEDEREQAGLMEAELRELESENTKLAASQNEIENKLRELRRELDETRRATAQKEGELQSTERDAKRTAERLDTVGAEYEQSVRQAESGENKRAELSAGLESLLAERDRLTGAAIDLEGELKEAERRFLSSQAELTECRLRHTALVQEANHAGAQRESGESRLMELQRAMQGRADGLKSYAESVTRLQTENETTQNSLAGLESDCENLDAKTEKLRAGRAEAQARMERTESKIQSLRRTLDDERARHSQLEVQHAEVRMHRQNRLERLQREYRVGEEDLRRLKEPEWPKGVAPPQEELQSRIAELRDRVEALGPVNLVAIEEYREHEERYAFLKAQEDDLTKGKARILDLISKINKESSELFRTTFDKANENFQKMFARLFGGGTARLALIDADDLLESGIEIVARPPGKRLQSVALLSGGERTMTAVALLFAIYMIKPSPFALLDELDASLDDSNIGRFVDTLKDFLEMSQFVIITHNQHTIAGADIVYGVTMPEKGVSSIVSMRLKEVGAATPEPTDTDAHDKTEPQDILTQTGSAASPRETPTNET